MVDYLKMISDQEGAFADLFTRMDKDKDLLIQKDFTLFDKDDREAPDVENLTLNDAAIFFNHVVAVLNRAGLTTEVEGEKVKDKETDFFEDFFRDYTLAVDKNLNRRGIPSVFAWNVQQMCGRGRAITRIVLRKEGDTFDPGVLPLDSRYVIYDYGRKGLKWIASKFPRNKQQIIDEYGEEIGGKLNTTSAVVTDLWIDEDEITFIEKTVVRNQKHYEEELPFIVQVCPVGIGFQDGDEMERSGESLLHLARKMYASKNKMASILDTLNMGGVFGGLQKEVEDENQAKKPAQPPWGKRFVVPVQKGTKGYFSMPTTDIQQATRLLYSILDSNIQDATLPRVSFGTLQAPTSGIGIAQLKEAEDPVYLPRIRGLELYYESFYRMVLDQYIAKKMDIKLGTPGFLKQYPSSELKRDISIKCKIDIVSPMQNMANISMAAAVGNLLSDDTKQRKYLQVEDIAGENMERLAEMASKVSPAVAKYEMAKALAEKGEEIKARLMAAEIGLTIDQLFGGQLGQEKIKPQEPKQMMAMFGAGQGGARAEPQIGEE